MAGGATAAAPKRQPDREDEANRRRQSTQLWFIYLFFWPCWDGLPHIDRALKVEFANSCCCTTTKVAVAAAAAVAPLRAGANTATVCGRGSCCLIPGVINKLMLSPLIRECAARFALHTWGGLIVKWRQRRRRQLQYGGRVDLWPCRNDVDVGNLM